MFHLYDSLTPAHYITSARTLREALALAHDIMQLTGCEVIILAPADGR